MAGDSEAAACAAQALESGWPQSPHAAYWAGYALLELDPPRALDHLKRANELDPNFARAYADRAIAELELGDTIAALASVERAVDIDPRDARSHMTLGHSLHTVGRPSDAAAALRRAVELDPTLPGARYGLGVVLAESDPESAIEAFESTVALAADHVDAWSNLGVLRLAAGEIDTAIAAFDCAAELAPTDPARHRDLAAAHASAGDARRAARAYAHVVRLAPRSESDHEYYCRLLEYLGDAEVLAAERSRFADANQEKES